MNVLVITCSPQQKKSSTALLAQQMIKQLSDLNTINVEYLDANSLPHIDNFYADAVCSSDDKNESNHGSLALSAQLITSLEVADMLIIATPLHNYTLPSCLKSWLDHVVRAGKTFEITSTGKRALLTNKPVYILVSSGGTFSSETAQQPDFFTPYMKEILATIGLKSLQFFTIEGTAANTTSVKQQIENLQLEVCEHLAATFN